MGLWSTTWQFTLVNTANSPQSSTIVNSPQSLSHNRIDWQAATTAEQLHLTIFRAKPSPSAPLQTLARSVKNSSNFAACHLRSSRQAGAKQSDPKVLEGRRIYCFKGGFESLFFDGRSPFGADCMVAALRLRPPSNKGATPFLNGRML